MKQKAMETKLIVRPIVGCLTHSHFWAPWCGPCRAIGPIIDELANEYEGKLSVVKLNVDESPSTPGKYGIRAIPTLILFKNGEVVEQVTGAVSKSSITTMIEQKALA